MPFHRRQRFAHLGSELARDLTERVQDIFSPRRHRLLLVQNAAGIAVPGAQAQHVLAAEAGDRAIQNCGARGSLTDLLREFRSQPRLLRLSHQRQLLLDLPVRNQAEERRLLKLHRQSLAQRVVEDRVTSLVVEIRENNRVLLGERRRAVEPGSSLRPRSASARLRWPEPSPASAAWCRAAIRGVSPTASRAEPVSRFRRWRSVANVRRVLVAQSRDLFRGTCR